MRIFGAIGYIHSRYLFVPASKIRALEQRKEAGNLTNCTLRRLDYTLRKD